MASVKFLQGTQSGYEALETKNPNYFYFTGDNLYLGNLKLSNAQDITNAVTSITGIETNIENIETSIGDLTSLETSEKTNLVNAINEVLNSVNSTLDNVEVTIEENSEDSTYSKVYTIKQGTQVIGTINIPKDMVVSSGTVEVNPEGQPEGTYIVLTLANATSDKIYINVGTLVDIYKPAANASQIQLAINAETREISATIVAGSVTSSELATDAVTTVKIADGNVTYAKLATTIQTSLGKADSAVQSVVEGTTNGSISVDGTEVSVHGLADTAFKPSTDFDSAGAANSALADAKTYANGLLTWNEF